MADIAVARPAATVVVLRPGEPFEILMVRRNDTVAFMAGSYVFPGGRVDENDRPTHGASLPPPVFTDLSAADEAAFRTAAVRELHEEANVQITIDDLMPFAHWVTPEIETRRYDTRFFLARMPDDQVAKHDEGETTALAWLSPHDALARFARKEMLLPPPTWTTIWQLARRSSIEDAFAWARSRPIVRVMPGFFNNGDEATLTLPGDPTFPEIPGWETPDETRFVLEDGVRWAPRKA
ncbi:MAG TPA: NUDIX hydrolase [Vicinamibacterales bacterium]|nr:NUDIX hydrolase [Vicinamibacterales bacterium]